MSLVENKTLRKLRAGELALGFGVHASRGSLVPILAKEESGPTLLLTRRNANLRDHAGQVSFPGGRITAADASPEVAALREAEEEIDLKPESVRIIGRLDTYVTGTGFEIVPVVGLVTPPLSLKIDPGEVEEVFEVPLEFLMTPAHHRRHAYEWPGGRREFLSMPWRSAPDAADVFIWGATAAMLRNFYGFLSA